MRNRIIRKSPGRKAEDLAKDHAAFRMRGFLRFGSAFSVPAVGAELAGLDPDGFLKIVQPVEAEGGEMEPFADLLYKVLSGNGAG